MSVAELQKVIKGLAAEDRRALAVIARRMAHQRSRVASERDMRAVLGCARRVKPGKNSRQILQELRGYDRSTL